MEAFRQKLGLLPEELIPHGKTPKLDFIRIMERLQSRPDGKYIEVTAITPVPGGVGAVTSAVLMRHVVQAAERTLEGGKL